MKMTEYVDIALSDLVLSRSDKTIIELPVFRYYVFIKPTSRFFETPESVRWVGGIPVRAVKEAVAQLLPEAEPAAALARGAGRGAAQEGDHLGLNRFLFYRLISHTIMNTVRDISSHLQVRNTRN